MYKTVEEKIYDFIIKKCQSNVDNYKFRGLCAKEIAENLNMHRSNVSSELNKLHAKGKIMKRKGRPVFYYANIDKEYIGMESEKTHNNFNNLIGNDKSLKKSIQQAKAAILYPPRGLHTLILGATGVGKTMFAEIMYKFAVENKRFSCNAPFVSFNCADYVNNSNLLLSCLFGTKRGAFTGADKDKIGIVEKANGGVLFLDEVHRLPPEGQEMLFYLIDKGRYTPLGDLQEKNCDVLIICATTEDINSVLLNTFIRRIPMIINIPDLKHRSLEERFELICEFFKMESKRIGKEIEVTNNTLRCLLLYDCVGNVGQLKSDIQLGCANAFLKYVSYSKNKIVVHITDLSDYAKKGIILYGKYENKVDKIINKETKLSFKEEKIKEYFDTDDYCIASNFYTCIEQRVRDLQQRNVDEKDIKSIISLDIENHFKKYVRKIKNHFKREQLSKIVGQDIVIIVEEFLDNVSSKTNKIFSDNIFSSLCLHVDATIERVKNSEKTQNYNLGGIKERYPEEYALAVEFIDLLNKKFNLFIPVDEAEFITIFLCADKIERNSNVHKPIIVVAMHGKNAASSTIDVVKQLIGSDNIFPYDMPLEKDSKEAYEELKDIIVKNHKGGGVILLVDMGSLNMFGDIIASETGINIKIIDNVSTLLIIECSRKALIEENIDNIYLEVLNAQSERFNSYLTKIEKDAKKEKAIKDYCDNHKEPLIITSCTTGEGGALKIKDIILKRFEEKNNYIKILNIAFNEKEEFINKIEVLKEHYKVICIVGVINPQLKDIKFIEISQLIKDKTTLDNIIYTYDRNDEYNRILINLLKEMNMSTDIHIIDSLAKLIYRLNKYFNGIEYNIMVGFIVHLICAIDRIKNSNITVECMDKENINENYMKELKCLKDNLKIIEEIYNINFNDDELCFMLKIIKKL